MATMTDDLYTLAKYFESLYVTFQNDLDLADVFYGDQSKIAQTPTLCIEPGDTKWELNGAPRRCLATLSIYLLVYHSLAVSSSEERELNDLQAKAIVAKANESDDLGGLVVHGLVTGQESGYSQKGNTFFRATRITYEGTSQVQLPSTI